VTAFRPAEPWTVAAIGAVLLVLLVGGYVLTRRAAGGWVPNVGWAILVAGVPVVERVTAREPAGVRMLALIVFALLTLKVIAVARERSTGMPPLSFTAWLAFSSAWLGMQPRLFTSYGGPARPGAPGLLRRGAINLAMGLAFVALARGIWSVTESRWTATIPVLVGSSLCLHFGLGTMLAGVWRLRGVETSAVFREPLRAESLAEFWAKRWNLGFSEMTAALIYRPLSRRVGSTAALLAGFLASGLLHEMAISVPVRAGFGLPTLYFVLHGVLVGVERRLFKEGRPLSGWFGRVWSMFWILAPLLLLFHPPFLAGVVWPLVGVPTAPEP
jgi:alginate O-acetyltransferase complex protein AlgI